MSLTTINPLIQDWIQRGLKWKYIWQPTYSPITIPPKDQVQLPIGDFIYRAPEGILLTFGASFDNPHCGIRMNNPQLDTLNSFTVNSVVFGGLYNQPWYLEANVPPQTSDGIYVINMSKSWPWTDWCELYVINEDSVAHTCYSFGYTLALLLEKRPPDPTETALMAMLANSLYPVEKILRGRMSRAEIEYWISRVKIGKIYEVREEG